MRAGAPAEFSREPGYLRSGAGLVSPRRPLTRPPRGQGLSTRRQASSCTYGAGVLDEPPDPVVPLMSTVADPPPDVVVPLIETVSVPPPPPVVPLLVPPPPPVVPLLVPPPPPVVPLILTVPPPLPVVPLRSCWCVWLAPFDVWSSNWSALMAAEPDPDPERVEAPVRSYPWVWLAVVPPFSSKSRGYGQSNRCR